MLKAKSYSATGELRKKTVNLPEDPFDGIVNEAVLHQVVKAYLANQRQGNASTKTRSDVRGGGRKIWRQKGTGRARQGSIRAPHWTGGGVAHGPKTRDYQQDVPKKVKQLARRSAFNIRAQGEQVAVIDALSFDAPKTRQVTDLLKAVGGSDRKVLILTAGLNSTLHLSARNLQNVAVRPFVQASPYEIMNSNLLLIEADALNGPEEKAPKASETAARKAPEAETPAAAEPTAEKTEPAAEEEVTANA
jgi:large subunit ribosomal protein L4